MPPGAPEPARATPCGKSRALDRALSCAGARARRDAAAGLMAGLLALGAACSTPVVSAQAVWIGEERGIDGSRTLFTYGSGTISSSVLRPVMGDPDAGMLPLLVELEPRGRGALVRGVDAGWLHDLGDSSGMHAGYLDLSRRRALPLWLPETRAAVDGARFSHSGDALMWVEGCAPALAVVPLVAGLPLTNEQHGATTTLAPLRRTIGAGAGKQASPRSACLTAPELYGLASAADAPIVFVVAAKAPASASGAPRAGGLIEALRVPVAADEPATLTLLAQARLPAGLKPAWLYAARCPGEALCGLAAVDPDGAALLVGLEGEDGCRLLRWEVASGELGCALGVDAPAALQAAQLVAAISAEELVLQDGATLHRYAWRSGELLSRPLPGASDDAMVVQVTPDGRAVVAMSSGGPLLRVASEGIELLNIKQHRCGHAQAPVLAPSGRVAAWTCGSSGETFIGGERDTRVGEVIRASAAGLEVYQGVPMWALAIDDAGDLLMSSRGGGNFSFELNLPAKTPSNLYVLSGEGVLDRIDGLEPDPELMHGLSPGTYRWIHARSL